MNSTCYTRADFVNSLSQNFAGSANNVNWNASYSYAPSPQMIANVATNDAYSYHPAPGGSASYAANGLNQYASVNGTSFAYDPAGNLTSDGARAFTYDPENRLLTASGSGIAGVALSYDPLGRLRTSASGGATKTLLYSGEDLVGEYDSSGAILARTVPGPGVDEPVAWYQGPGTANRQWPHMDMQGSIVAWSNATGAPVGSQGYDPYGQPANWSAGNRYAYTGQIMIPEAHLYSFKARMYDPGLGRFLQTDPIGQASDVNLYAYVGNDPVNGWDPSGMATQVEEFVVQGKIIKCVNGCTSLDTVIAAFNAVSHDFSVTNPGGTTRQLLRQIVTEIRRTVCNSAAITGGGGFDAYDFFGVSGSLAGTFSPATGQFSGGFDVGPGVGWGGGGRVSTGGFAGVGSGGGGKGGVGAGIALNINVVTPWFGFSASWQIIGTNPGDFSLAGTRGNEISANANVSMHSQLSTPPIYNVCH